ncbi:MAG: hypothetical protein O3A29_20805 [Planctomycetota bacterium]|nr:hypothetical protein [Planctomycetota bacterium]
MFKRYCNDNRDAGCSNRRRGIATVWTIIGFPAIIVGFIVVAEYGNITLAKIELENAIEAGAIAGINQWSQGNTPANRTAARNAAVTFTAGNVVRRQPVVVVSNETATTPTNPNGNAACDGNIVLLGTIPIATPDEFNANIAPNATSNLAVTVAATVDVPSLFNSPSLFSPAPYRVSARATAVASGPGYAIRVFWTQLDPLFTGSEIHRADPDGSNHTVILDNSDGLFTPSGIAVDSDADKVYWTDNGTGTILVPPAVRRSNLDGSVIEDLVTTDPAGRIEIDLDPIGGKMYWTDTAEIKRSNFDGTGEEIIVAALIGPTAPVAIAVDADNGKVYWTDALGIQRANLDGTNVETVFATDEPPVGIDIDSSTGKIYWTQNGTEPKIRRANLDGSGDEDVIDFANLVPALVNLPVLVGIAVDPVGGKMYWVDSNPLDSKIQRANFDGTVIETIVSIGAVTALPQYLDLEFLEPLSLAGCQLRFITTYNCTGP